VITCLAKHWSSGKKLTEEAVTGVTVMGGSDSDKVEAVTR